MKIPFPLATIVIYQSTKYLIDGVLFNSGNPLYSLIGHKKLKSDGFGCAWEYHGDLKLIENPSIKSWKMLGEIWETNREF